MSTRLSGRERAGVVHRMMTGLRETRTDGLQQREILSPPAARSSCATTTGRSADADVRVQQLPRLRDASGRAGARPGRGVRARRGRRRAAAAQRVYAAAPRTRGAHRGLRAPGGGAPVRLGLRGGPRRDERAALTPRRRPLRRPQPRLLSRRDEARRRHVAPFPHNDVDALAAALARAPGRSGRRHRRRRGRLLDGGRPGAARPHRAHRQAPRRRRRAGRRPRDGRRRAGRAGSAVKYGVEQDIDVVVGTFSKTFAVSGGFVACSREIATYLRLFSRSYFFSASLPPPTLAAVLAGLDLLEAEPERHAQLHAQREAADATASARSATTSRRTTRLSSRSRSRSGWTSGPPRTPFTTATCSSTTSSIRPSRRPSSASASASPADHTAADIRS